MSLRKARRRGVLKPKISGGTGAARFPGDPGAGQFYIGVAGGPRQQTDAAGNPLSDIDACTSWSQRPTAIYHDYSTATNTRVDTGKLDTAINNNCVASQSFKLSSFTPAQIVAGNANADLTISANDCMARAPWPIWLCYYHEPEDNFPSETEAADYRAAYRHIVQHFRNAGVQNVAWLPIYQCPYTFRTTALGRPGGGSNRDWRRWHADWNGGNTLTSADWHSDRMMDLFGLDIYNPLPGGTSNQDFDTMILDTYNDIQADGFGPMPPIVVPEFGMSDVITPTDPTWNTDYCPDVLAWAQSDDVVGIIYWNHNSDTPPRYDFQAASDADGSKLAGWRVITAAASNYPPEPPPVVEQSFVGADADGGNVTSLTGIQWPVVQAGDVAILWWTMSTSVVPTPAPPTGFTLIETYDANSGSQRNYLYYKVCSGSESGTLTLTLDLSTRQSACLWVGRGFHATTPIDGFSKFDETAAGTTHDAPSYTLINADCGILTLVGERGSSGTNDYTPPSGFDQNHIDSLALAFGTGGTISAIASDDLNQPRAASTVVNPGNWVSANGFSTANAVVYTLALRPA